MKIVLVGVNSKFIHSNLAVRYLKAFTKELDYECVIREFSINDRPERVIEELMLEKPDVLAFSCYIWNVDFIERLTRIIKVIRPSLEILYGGPEVSYDSELFLRKNPGEYVIAGEGEKTYYEFVQYKLDLKDKYSIKGLFIKNGNEIFYGSNRPLMNMEELVFPYEEDDDLTNKIVYYEGSRGCPFSCKYCLSSTTQGVRSLNIDRIKKELKFFMDRKVKLVKFVDRTFNFSKRFSDEIWSFIIDSETETRFHFEISADLISDEQVQILSRTPRGRMQFEIGVQTTNDVVLDNIDRHVNFKHLRNRILELKVNANIHQHLDLIAGLPGEGFDSFKKSFDDVYSLKPEQLQLGFLKLLRGSSMRAEAENYKMKYSPFAPYEILSTSDISYEELIVLKRLEEVLDKYYNSGKFPATIKYFEMKYSSIFEFYRELGQFFYEKGYFKRSLSNAEYYKVFMEFDGSSELNEIIKFDYLLYNKRRAIPDFLHREELEKEYKTLKNQHIEKFNIDVISFITKGNIEEKVCYVMFQGEDYYEIKSSQG